MSPDQREAREREDFPEQQDPQEKEARKVRVACVMLTAHSGSISVVHVNVWEGFCRSFSQAHIALPSGSIVSPTLPRYYYCAIT